MAGTSVAVEGEVMATAGSMPYTGADSGTWTPGTVSYKTYDKLKVGGKSVIHEASCQFDFIGTKVVGNTTVTVTGNETVTLSASSKKLQNKQANVLVNGDSQEGQFGNKLSVQTTNVLKTS